MPSLPTVSVVLPAYNAEAYVAEAVRSVLAQTYAPVEIRCVDDGSTDGTLDVLRALEQEAPERVRVLMGPNGGAPVARNRGLAEATGDYIQFLDADDLLLPTKLEHQATLVATPDPPDLVIGAYQSISFTGEGEPEAPSEMHCRYTLEPWTALLSSRQGITSSNLWRREAVVAAGGWNEGLPACQDSELVFRLLKQSSAVIADPEPLTVVRLRPGSVWRRDLRASYQEWFSLRESAVRYLRERGEYTAERRSAAEDAMWRKIQNVDAIDPSLAERYRASMIPPSYIPPDRRASATYRLLHRLVGHSGAAWLYPF